MTNKDLKTTIREIRDKLELLDEKLYLASLDLSIDWIGDDGQNRQSN